jgi:hypothetical protein
VQIFALKKLIPAPAPSVIIQCAKSAFLFTKSVINATKKAGRPALTAKQFSHLFPHRLHTYVQTRSTLIVPQRDVRSAKPTCVLSVTKNKMVFAFVALKTDMVAAVCAERWMISMTRKREGIVVRGRARGRVIQIMFFLMTKKMEIELFLFFNSTPSFLVFFFFSFPPNHGYCQSLPR